MNNKQNMNNCYVFNQTTLDLALQKWQILEKDNNPSEEEIVLIALKAMPWFLEHIKQTGPTYMFTSDILITELEAWKLLQITEYPKQKQRIEETCEQLLSFFQSDIIIKYKMMIQV
ncbi:MAG: hypothetical protein ACI88H_000361 [Cocleimonas sp.]|jgi:hypothetical protein